RLRIQETGPDGEERMASLVPFDPVAVISAVQGAAGIDIKGLDKRKEEQLLRHARDGKEDGEKLPVDPDLIEKLIMLAGREPFAPATAEEPRPWAGADETIIDQMLDRIGTLEEQALQQDEEVEAHSMLSDHWSRRLDVAREALKMIPAGKRGGMVAAIAGEDNPVENRVEKALKIARFAADEDRNIEGVDR